MSKLTLPYSSKSEVIQFGVPPGSLHQKRRHHQLRGRSRSVVFVHQEHRGHSRFAHDTWWQRDGCEKGLLRSHLCTTSHTCIHSGQRCEYDRLWYCWISPRLLQFSSRWHVGSNLRIVAVLPKYLISRPDRN